MKSFLKPLADGIKNFFSSEKLFLSVVVTKEFDTDVPAPIIGANYVGVSDDKSAAQAFAKTAAHKDFGNKDPKAKTQAIMSLDGKAQYKEGQELFLIPKMKMDTRAHVLRHGLLENAGYYAITGDEALANKTLKEISGPGVIPEYLVRVKYISPKK